MGNRDHKRSWLSAITWVVLVAPLGLVWAGCANHQKAPTAPAGAGAEACAAPTVFYRGNFSNSSNVVDNRWYPLVPGTQFILDGVANRGGGLLPHRVVFTVTDLTKEINGVRAVVLWDRDYNSSALQEAELAFHAQDREGNVWVLGEYPEEYQNGDFIGAPSVWISGLAGAEAGIIVPQVPYVGARFLQGFAPDINFLDCASVFMTGQRACVPFDCYENGLVMDETSPLEPGSGHQRKFYAPGVGNVQVGAVDDPEGETLVLVNVLHLDPRELAEASAEALKLEEHAYQINEIYRYTPRMRLPGSAPPAAESRAASGSVNAPGTPPTP